jgi:hypothetical protein
MVAGLGEVKRPAVGDYIEQLVTITEMSSK